MKVQNELPAGSTAGSAIQPAEAGQLQRINRFRSPEGGAAGAHDQVELSGLASHIVRANETSASDRARHVESLAKAYQNGRYSVDPHALSRKLVSSWSSPKSDA